MSCLCNSPQTLDFLVYSSHLALKVIHISIAVSPSVVGCLFFHCFQSIQQHVILIRKIADFFLNVFRHFISVFICQYPCSDEQGCCKYSRLGGSIFNSILALEVDIEDSFIIRAHKKLREVHNISPSISGIANKVPTGINSMFFRGSFELAGSRSGNFNFHIFFLF